MVIRDVRPPIILVIHSDRDFSLADRFVSELNLLSESNIVRVRSWFISDRYANQEENRTTLRNNLIVADVVLLLASRNLLNSIYYRQFLFPQIREIRNNARKSFLSIILSPVSLDERGTLLELRDGERQNIFPTDGRSIFGEHLPEEMEGAFAEIIESIFLELAIKYYQPSGVSSAQKQNVFISYSRNDFKIANIIRGVLSGQGYDVWMDKYNMKGGQNWVKSIDDGIRNSWALILLMSHTSRASENVAYEWSFAIGANTCVVPVMIENVSLPSRLSWINYLSWYHLNVSQYHWDELVDSLDFARSNADKGKCNS